MVKTTLFFFLFSLKKLKTYATNSQKLLFFIKASFYQAIKKTNTNMESTLLINNVSITICMALASFIHLGFSLLEIGLTRQKNTINILFKNIFTTTDLLLYFLFRFSLIYPSSFNGILGFAEFGLTPTLTSLNTLDLTYNSGFSENVCCNCCYPCF
ncbi:hypothetical protein [Tenacibaculum maritimum]|uniref:hypothetical protein n=1 Tax=Tenacibaculum maritimum TaxID=107401 RepID=UPI0030B91DEE